MTKWVLIGTGLPDCPPGTVGVYDLEQFAHTYKFGEHNFTVMCMERNPAIERHPTVLRPPEDQHGRHIDTPTCVTKDGARAIKDAVHTDIEASRSVYNWVVDLCVGLGAKRDDLVPFEKYAAAAQGLSRPSSAASARRRWSTRSTSRSISPHRDGF